MVVHQLDVETAFLHGQLDELIYMAQPPGFVDSSRPDAVCLLKRSLYGLKQSPRCWNTTLDTGLRELQFTPTTADPCIYTGTVQKHEVILGVYVDDMLIACSSSQVCQEVKKMVSTKFAIKDLGTVSFFLGVSIHQSEQQIKLNQPTYISNILARFGMEDCHPIGIPMGPTDTLTQRSEGEARADQVLYQQIIGSLMYLSTATRPDISYAVHRLARYAADPSAAHLNAARKVLRYLKGSKELGLRYFKTDAIKLACFCDSDWAGCPESSRSTSGLVCLLSGGPVCWLSRRQRLVTKSTAEAEFVALSETVCEVVWLRQLLDDLGRFQEGPTPIYEDNAAAVVLANNPTSHQRTKHIMVKLRFVGDRIANGTVQVQQIPTTEQIADGLTKPLPLASFRTLISGLGMVVG